MPTSTTSPSTERGVSWPVLVLLLLFVGSTAIFSGIGTDDPLGSRVAIMLAELVYSGWMPAAYLLGAFGLGTLYQRFLPKRTPTPLLWTLGLASMLTVTHAFGVLGLLSPITVWIITGAGISIAFFSMRGKQLGNIQKLSAERTILLGCMAIGLGIAVVAASNPPGALWDSEFGAYDSLSYHLELPKEWLASGRIWPTHHNVYSYHPGYIESAYTHLALLGGQPAPMQSTHFFGLSLLLLSAWNVAALIRKWTDQLLAPLLGSAMVLLTPWSMVVSTISYNEPGVLALGSAALLLASMGSVRPIAQGTLLGVLVGGAVCCKMTAIFFVAPPVAVLLFTASPRAVWLKLILSGAITGTLMLLPWMTRNMIDTGNPVFPQLSSIFGSGHWTSEQLARFSGAHQFDGSAVDRLRLLILPDGTASEHIARFRGLTNLQWGLLPAFTLVGIALLLARRDSHRRGAALLLALTLPILTWLAFTHLQSRFFVPMIPLAAIVIALGCSELRPRVFTSTMIAIGSLVWCIVIFANQNNGHPNALLVVGSSIYTDPVNIEGTPTALTWTARLNGLAGTDETVYLLGDATPFYLRLRVLSHTTYDASPLASIIAEQSNDPVAWIVGLRAVGADWIVINRSELERLSSSGWLDPALSPEHLRDLTDTLGAYPSIELDQSRTAYMITEPTNQ
ncbi:MAG: hypothetical protein KC996_01475 [Phycisphaerales bacterium]|nr:hypothetical protein [Phycisphaerales bacterium]